MWRLLPAIAVCNSHDAIFQEALLPDGKDDDDEIS